jgi:hypothetical protein
MIKGVVLATAIAVLGSAAILVGGLIVGDRFAGVPTADLEKLCLILFAALPAAMARALAGRFLVSARRTRLLLLFAGITLVGNVGGDLLGASLIGLYGIALATTLTSYIAAGVYLYICGRILAEITAESHGGERTDSTDVVASQSGSVTQSKIGET